MLTIPKHTYWLVGIGIALWVVYSITAWQQIAWPVFSSPDETANFSFAQQDRFTSETIIPTSAPGAPRSVINTGSALVPGSFVFFPYLIGFVGKVFGTFGMLMLGPALAAAAIVAWYAFVRTTFASKSIAWVSASILATFPTYWFYASRGLWQNGLFTSFLILSIASTVWAWRARYWGISALCGLVWGVTIAIRPSEISWLTPGVIIALVLVWRRIPWKHFWIVAVCAAVPILSLFLFQWRTYDSPLAIGYRPTGALEPAPIVQELGTLQQVKNVFFPFGTNPNIAWKTFTTYGTKPLSYIIYPAVVGLLWLLWRTTPAGRRFLVAGLVGGVFLFVLYGNYRFIEYPAVREAVLDGSYLRYWLPLAALVALGWGGIVDGLRGTTLGKRLGYVSLGTILTLNIALLVNDRTIGLRHTMPRVREAQAQSRWIVENTPPNAIVIAGSRDKLVFPRRHAIGFNGTVPSGLDLGEAPGRLPTYIVLSNPSQVVLLDTAFPTLTSSAPVVGPDQLTLVQLLPR